MEIPTLDLAPLRADPYFNNIQQLCQLNNLELSAVEGEIARTYESPTLRGIPAGLPRMRQAAGIVFARYSRDNIVKVEPYTLRVLAVQAPRDITVKGRKKPMHLSSLTGIAQSKKTGAKVGLADVTFYDSSAELIEQVKEGEVYEVNLSGFFKDGRWKLTADKRASFKTTITPEVDSLWALPITDLVAKLYPRTNAIELASKVGKIAMVEGNVVLGGTRLSKKNFNFGKLTLTDESLTPADLSAGKAVSVTCAAEDAAKLGRGSRVIVIGPVTKDPTYGLSLGAPGKTTVIPVFIIQDEEEADEGNGKAVDFSDFKDDEEEGGAPASPEAAPSQPPAGEFDDE